MIELHGRDIEVGVVERGARLARLRTPDRNGVLADIVLGLDPPDYRHDRAYLAATVGRYANRIAGGAFSLDGHRYTVPCNEDGVALHGGTDGFDQQIFSADPVLTLPGGSQSVTFRRTSPDGENGFPGTLDVAVTYTVGPAELRIEHTARTDRPTVVNLTNHAYYNLSGRPGTVEDHLVRIPAGHYLPVDHRLIPTGERARVDGTPFDLRTPVRLGDRLRENHPQLLRTRGFDHTLVLDRSSDEPALAAHVVEPTSGRSMSVDTDQPGVQLYSGNFLDGSTVVRGPAAARQGDRTAALPELAEPAGLPQLRAAAGEAVPIADHAALRSGLSRIVASVLHRKSVR